MKTNKSSTQLAELKVQSGQRSESTDTDTRAPRQPLPRLDFAKREANRQLPTDALISLLRTEAPRFFELAEVIGRWVWIQFPDKQPREITSQLSQFGFHWNATRQCWQHPCGETLPRGEQEPREKYASYFPADQAAA